MVKKWVALGLAVVIIAAGIYLIYLYKLYKPISDNKLQEPVKETAIAENKWSEYKNDKHKIYLQVPESWTAEDTEIQENMDLWAVFMPQEPTGQIGQVGLAIVSQPKDNQTLTTEKEFIEWANKENNTKGKDKEIKIMNNDIDGIKAITLYNEGENETMGKYWMILTWWRKDGINYYLSTIGKGKDTDFELQMHLNILDRIRFLP